MKKGDVVYRIIELPTEAGRNFCKYGVHKYLITDIDEDYDDLFAKDEIGTERIYDVGEFKEHGLYETEYTAKLGIKRLLFEEYKEAWAQLDEATANWDKFQQDYPEV